MKTTNKARPLGTIYLYFKHYSMEQAIEQTSMWAWWDFCVFGYVIKIDKMSKVVCSENIGL